MAQDAADGAGWNSELGADPVLTAAMLASTRHDLLFDLVGHLGRHRVRTRRPVVQPGIAFGVVAGQPAVGTLPGDTHGFGDMSNRHAEYSDPVNEQTATVHGQTSVTVGHEDLLVVKRQTPQCPEDFTRSRIRHQRPGRVQLALTSPAMAKVAIVTGAGRGQGAAEVKMLRDRGWSVVATDVAGDVDVVHDVSDAEGWAAVVDATRQRHGAIDGLVNNAGIHHTRAFLDEEPAEIERLFRVNTLGAVFGIQAVAPVMRDHGGGSIVNIASVAGRRGVPGHLAYGASKWALRGVTQTAARELGPLGIRVNAVLPGGVDTQMLGSFRDQSDAFAALPLGRVGTPDEVAEVVAFLLSDASSYLTAAEIAVDGGYGI